MINDQSTADLVIESFDNTKIYCHKTFMIPNFSSE